MPLFRVENAAASTGGVFLLPYPFVDWFSQAILGAVAEMCNPRNWVGSSTEEIEYAVRESNRMLEGFKVLAFNPFPIGLIIPFSGGDAPPGYLLCDGGSYATEDYPELFAVVGYTYGGSSSNFNVPNLVNRMAVGSGDDYSLGVSGGEANHTLSESEIPSHAHTIPTTATTLAVEPGEVTVLTPIPFFNTYTGNTGGGEAHNNMPPFLALSHCIYAGR